MRMYTPEDPFSGTSDLIRVGLKKTFRQLFCILAKAKSETFLWLRFQVATFEISFSLSLGSFVRTYGEMPFFAISSDF